MSNSTEAEIRRAQAEASLDRLAALIRFAASWAVTGMGCAISLGATFALVLGGGDATRGLIALVFGLALVLVGAVVLLAGAALGGTGMEQASNLLLGGVVASAASAVAFYFASRTVQNAQQNVLDAQKNIIDASGGTVIVPHLKGLTVKAAEANLKALGLRLKYEGSDLDVQVRDQQPDAEVSVPRQTEITVVA